METFIKPFIIPIFIPQVGCSHQCIFCNQSLITGVQQSIPSPKEITSHINGFLKYRKKSNRKTQVAIFGGNFLGLSNHRIEQILDTIKQFIISGQVADIRFSTRPDTINKDSLYTITQYPVSTIEIGAQSMSDQILKISNRGHNSTDTETAVELLKKKRYEVGIQMMVGLPGDDEQTALDTTHKIIDLSPDFVRIYPTLVLKNSPLDKLYQNGSYKPLSLKACVSLVKKIYLLFHKNNIPVIRMGLQPTTDLESGDTIQAGPYHPSFGHLVYSEIYFDKMVSLISQKISHKNIEGSDLTIRVHSKNISTVRGIKNHNIDALSQTYHFKTIEVTGDDSLPMDTIILI